MELCIFYYGIGNIEVSRLNLLFIKQLFQKVGWHATCVFTLSMTQRLCFGNTEWQLAYRVALKVLKAPDQAEDAAQETLINAYLARHTFAGRAKPHSWLYRIAHNTALSYLRKPFHRRYASDDVHLILEKQTLHCDSPEDTAVARQIAGRLRQCLDTLGTKDRVAFTERFIQGTTERELGTILGVSTNAAKQRAFRARRMVRSQALASGITT